MNSRRLNDTLRETGLKEGHDHFLAHFISFYPNGWTYHGMKTGRGTAIIMAHHLYCPRRYLGHRTSPPCMNGSDHLMLWVVKQHGHTIGRADTYTQPWASGNQSVNPFQEFGFV